MAETLQQHPTAFVTWLPPACGGGRHWTTGMERLSAVRLGCHRHNTDDALTSNMRHWMGAGHKQLTRRLDRHIGFLERELAKLDSDIGEAIKASPVWYETEALLKIVPRIGDVTARTLLAKLPELSTIDRHQIAALVGIAPINSDSGLMRGRRSIAGGRTSVRGVLYLAALTAIRRGSPFRPFYERLTKRGRPKKVSLVSVMRKLLVTLKAIIHNRTPWRSITA